MECMRQYISELLDFIADMHTLTKLKVGTTTHALFTDFGLRKVYLIDFLSCRAI